MSEERLIHIESMMAELIRIVGNTNSAVEELRAETSDLRSAVSDLRSAVSDLRSEISKLHEGQARIIARLDRIEADVREIKENQKSLFEIAGEHEVAIRTLRRRPV